MALADTVRDLATTLERAGVEFRLERPNASDDGLTRIFGPRLMGEMVEGGYVGDADLPWPAETLTLYGLSDIAARQAGYRFDANSAAPSLGWGEDHFVIADALADLVTIDASGAVWFARHGEGQWDYRPIADDLDHFLRLLCRWVDFFVMTSHRQIYADDLSVRDDIVAAVEHDVVGFLSSAHRCRNTCRSLSPTIPWNLFFPRRTRTSVSGCRKRRSATPLNSARAAWRRAGWAR